MNVRTILGHRESFSMATAGDVVKQFYDAAIARDLAKARTCLHNDLVFVGLFETLSLIHI